MTSIRLFPDYDPDLEENKPKKMAWQTPKDERSIRALRACRKQGLQNIKFTINGIELREDKHLKQIIERTLGATEDAILYTAWIDNCIAYAASMNSKGIRMKFENMLKYMSNNDKMVNWIADNREKILKQRKVDIIETFHGD